MTLTDIELDQTLTSLEKIPIKIVDNESVGSKIVAQRIATKVRQATAQKPIVLGLATGESPVKVYNELVRMHREDNLSFHHVITFNLDEYYQINNTSRLSYYFFMHHHLFNHIDILAENIHIPDGQLPNDKVTQFCREYDQKIIDCGGIDIQLLGIGRTGHIGFNEPNSQLSSETRMVKLHPITILDATREFLREDLVPRRAITMGITSIIKAKEVLLLAWGEKKARIIKESVQGDIIENIPATFLQKHPNVEFIIDENASSELTRIKYPWIVSLVEWNEKLSKKAVIWLSKKLNKPILKLTTEDYKDNGLGDLVDYAGDSTHLNVKVFNTLQYTITGWPGGKPDFDDTNRPERKYPTKKRIIIFSPHPDDDVISMGGTFLKLVEQGHDVHVAYQTSGNIAVFDDDARRFTEFAKDLASFLKVGNEKLSSKYREVVHLIEQEKSVSNNSDLIRHIKGLIRKGEASAAARFCGLSDTNIHFLNMPFYETGKTNKNSLSNEDTNILIELLQTIKPHQIFAAGDLRDPHGTHKVCLDAIFIALKKIKTESWSKDCNLWLYRGAWQEWDITDIQMAVPLSPSDLMKKRHAIFKHQSQKDSPVFPGNDKREFWQRAENRNRKTAQTYDRIGLAEYEAMEAFVKFEY